MLVEVLYTKYQGGPVIYQGRDNYYNNGTYIIGWQYQQRIIGTPLFLNTQNADNYQLGSAAYSWPVISNRVIAGNLGLKGALTSKLKYRVLATHVRHYGNYYNTPYFASPKTQTSLLAEVPCQLGRLVATAAVASDFGDFGTNTAGILRLAYQLY